MNPKVNLVLGGSGLIGKNLKNIYNNKNIYYISSSKKNGKFVNFNLNKNFKHFPFKNIDICFFFASPRILRKNLNQKKFFQEYKWLNKVINNLDINKMIYLSSSSIYYSKNHIIGANKKKCEELILKNKSKFKNYQIWRPFNLVGNYYEHSDHFHNVLFKNMFIKRNSYALFKGNKNDKRAYSSVDDFVKILLKYSKKNISFTKDFGNLNLCKIEDVINLYNKHYFRIFKKNFKFKFISKTPNINKIKKNKNNVYINSNSLKILNKYLKNSLNDKKV